jgi:transposase
VPGESEDGHIVYSRPLVALVAHYGFLPRACRPDGAETKAKVERPFRDLPEGVFPARRFRDLEDLNFQLGDWVANVRLHGTTQRLAVEASAEERPRL